MQVGQFGASNDDLLALNPSQGTVAVSPPASTLERLGHFLARAMLLLESDHEAVRKCLTDAATLLGSEARKPGMSSAHAFRPGGLMRWQARRVLVHIESNLGSKMAVHELAQLVGLSVSHFSKAFTRSFRFPPMKYVATRRVERAKFLMTSTSKQLSAIALACGFADQSHLTRCFRRIVGTSPGIWRRINDLPAEVSYLGPPHDAAPE